ncbi:MAG: prepilin-type N-terminal cleavage/methylation domain-containing protein [Candidatus Riflebacteria bacterium]|nr:prepilin-type N-terminal cleavage/methylation domain-containing protein [Candidatus Riflebacteria bacterium]
MKRIKKTGFTIVEILIAMGIVAVIAGGAFVSLRSAKKELMFGAEHFSAILIGQKVMEDLSQEIAVNPHAFTSLGIDSGSLTEGSVVNGGSIFFTRVEDRVPPWGSINSSDEGVIDEKMQPLFKQLKNFQVSAKASRQAPVTSNDPARNLYDTEVEVTWKNSESSGKYKTNCIFASVLSQKQPRQPFVLPPEEIENEITVSLFGEPTMTLSEVLADKGGDPATIQSLGRLYAYSDSLLNSSGFLQLVASVSTSADAVASFTGTVFNKSQYEMTRNVASGSMEIARLTFHLTHSLLKDAELVMNNFDLNHLGNHLWYNTHTAARPLKMLRDLNTITVSHIVQAQAHYALLLEEGMAKYQDSRKRQMNMLKVMDLCRILLVHPTKPFSKDSVDKFFEHLLSVSEKHDSIMARYVVQERTFIGDKTELCKRYPSLNLIRDTFEQVNKIQNFCKSPPAPADK